MDLSDLIDSIDIVDYISQFVELEEKNGEFWGLSPFKDEKTPSFSVRRESGRFYDFSSGIGGSVITFIQYYCGITKREAIEKVKNMVCSNGETITQRAHIEATKSCKKFLKKSRIKKPKNKASFKEDYMDKYEKSPDKLSVWEDEGISKKSLDRFDVRYDSFSNRIVYPIRDTYGNIVNIGGRTLDPDWKEKGLRKYTYFSGWDDGMGVIYGLYENMEYIMSKKEVIIFEGCKSVLIADSWGIHNTGALLTSHLNPVQMVILSRLGVRVVFALDKDVDVGKDHNIDRLKRYVNVDVIHDYNNLLEDKDSPVDKGIDVFVSLYKGKKRIK